MRYAGIIEDDFVNGEGVCLSFWAQGCPHRCQGCHNPQTHDYNGGIEDSEDNIVQRVIEGISKNGIQRNFSILGGEPLCPENISFIELLTYWVKLKYPDVKIFLWTGYELSELLAMKNNKINKILDRLHMIATGRFDLSKRDITLKYIGSSNQKILYKGVDF